MNLERGNQFLVSSVLVSLYAVTKVLGQIWGPPFCSGIATAGGNGRPFLRLWVEHTHAMAVLHHGLHNFTVFYISLPSIVLVLEYYLWCNFISKNKFWVISTKWHLIDFNRSISPFKATFFWLEF